MNEQKQIMMRFGKTTKTYDVIEEPVPHILVPSKKKIHAWKHYGYADDRHHRECSQERMLINTYNGCWQNGLKGCRFCYTRGMVFGYFPKFWKNGVATVFNKFDEAVMKQISKLYACSPLYLSPITDPFMDLEAKYHINKRVIDKSLKLNLPSEFITKMGGNLLKWDGYPGLIDKMSEHKHCFGQFTIYTMQKGVKNKLSPGSSQIDTQFKAVKMCSDKGLFTVVRFDPFIPYVTDSENEFRQLVGKAKEAGANHIIASCIDIPKNTRKEMFPLYARLSQKYGNEKNVSDFKELYSDNQRNDLNACLKYRREKFGLLRDICNENNITLSFCMEFWKDDDGMFHGLNDEFMTSSACEGMKIPMYVRDNLSENFRPLEGCDGNCLNHAKGKGECNGVCEYDRFEDAMRNDYSDYKKFRMPSNQKNINDYLK
jgi:DNA repair photolyase